MQELILAVEESHMNYESTPTMVLGMQKTLDFENIKTQLKCIIGLSIVEHVNILVLIPVYCTWYNFL